MLKIVVINGLEQGGGGGMYGDEHFKNITVRVRKVGIPENLGGQG